MRYPGIPTTVLNGHNGPINSIKWHPTQQKLLSGGDDCQALIWDLTSSKPQYQQQQQQPHHNSTHNSTGTNSGAGKNPTGSNQIVEYPDFAYNDTLEINNITWNSDGDWIGVVSGKGFQGVKTV